MASTPPLEGESPAQKQARLRRERRSAKIQAGGADRLSKITQVSGRPAATEAELARTPTPPLGRQPSSGDRQPPAGRATVEDDPDEVDLSSFVNSQPTAVRDGIERQPQADLLRQLLAQTGSNQGQTGGPAGYEQGPAADDPLLQMMQQLMGAGPGSQGTAGSQDPQLPPGLAQMLGQPQDQEVDNRNDYVWRIAHAVFAIILGIYAATHSAFSGSLVSRSVAAEEEQAGQRVFWIFSTAELVLQSSRYFIDKGKLPVPGILSTLGQLLPDPYGNYVRLYSRYSVIITTLFADAMLVIFILGCMAWWKGGAAH